MAIALANAARGLDLKLARVEAGISQGKLAAELGVSRQQVSYWEAVYRPSEEAIERYRAALARISAQ